MQVDAPSGARSAKADILRLNSLIDVYAPQHEERTRRLKAANDLVIQTRAALNGEAIMPNQSEVHRAIKALSELIDQPAGNSWFDRLKQGLDERRADSTASTSLRSSLDDGLKQRAASPRQAGSHRPNSQE